MRASSCPDLALPKGTPRLIEKRERKASRDAQDRAERKLCHVRSGGRCEVVLVTHRPEESAIITKRCKQSARHNHHLIGGIGRRNVGESLLAAHRLDVCADHHREIEDAIIEPYRIDEAHDAATVKYIEVAR